MRTFNVRVVESTQSQECYPHVVEVDLNNSRIAHLQHLHTVYLESTLWSQWCM